MADGFRLVVTQGPQPGQTFHLEGETIGIGRDPGNEIVISHPQVSRQHARLVRRGGLMVLEDLGSTNGTFVNGMRLTAPHTLSNGDVIGLGNAVTLTFYGEAPGVGETVVAYSDVVPSPVPPSVPRPAFVPPKAPPAPVKKRRTGLWIGLGCLGLLFLACVALGLFLWFAPPSFWEMLLRLGIPVPAWPF